MNDPSDLRSWPAEDLLILARAAGELWASTGRDDPYDVLSERQRQLLDRAAASYLVAEQETQASWGQLLESECFYCERKVTLNTADPQARWESAGRITECEGSPDGEHTPNEIDATGRTITESERGGLTAG